MTYPQAVAGQQQEGETPRVSRAASMRAWLGGFTAAKTGRTPADCPYQGEGVEKAMQYHWLQGWAAGGGAIQGT
ncbi:MAG TPA: Rmf/CrpP family protein [Kineosporiaceae bacterium]|nr:Rmf/CrpP family protein [Kineosporiaceae bacterium]